MPRQEPARTPDRPARATERTVLRVLVIGFALVVALLSLAGYVAVRSTRAIETDAAQVGREQLAMARLLNDAQAGQNTLAGILRQLAPGQPAANRVALLAELETADRALNKAADSARETPEAPRWQALSQAVRDFSFGVRLAVQRTDTLRGSDLIPLFDQHDRVVRLEQQLLDSSEKRMEATEQLIEAESRDLAFNSRLLLGACLVLALLCAIFTLVFARSSIRKIEWQASELSRVSWHMLQSQETLARRFSHELHDELGQSLAAVKANLTAGQAVEWPSRRADCLELVDTAIANVRELSQLLHPVILDDFGLDAGLRWLTDGFAQRTGINTTYASTFHDRLDDQTETHLFRMAQEALTNVARHSGAGRVTVELDRIGERGDRVRLAIEDNGRGLPPAAAAGQNEPARPSLGMTGMRARAQEINAEFTVVAPKGGGLRLEVDLPLPREKGVHAEQEDPHPVSR